VETKKERLKAFPLSRERAVADSFTSSALTSKTDTLYSALQSYKKKTNLPNYSRKMPKNLVVSKKSRIFATAKIAIN